MKPDIHPKYYEAKVHCGSCGTEWTVGSTPTRAARGRVQQLPPVLHGQADHHRHGRPGRAVPEAPGAPGPQLAGRRVLDDRSTAGRGAGRSDSGTVRRPEATAIHAGALDVRSGRGADGTPRSGTPTFTYGGQALIEGVLMRGRDAIAVALRHPDGRIVYCDRAAGLARPDRAMGKWPFVRGLVVLYETLVVGTRWLVRSANVQAEEDDVELGKGTIAIMLLVTFGVGDRRVLPPPAVHLQRGDVESETGLAATCRRGVIRVALFLAYLVFVSRMPTSSGSSSTTARST